MAATALGTRFLPAAMALLLVISACSNAQLTPREWQSKVWEPSLAAVPSMADAGAQRCERSLTELRDLDADGSRAPSGELQTVYNQWSEAAKSLMFECSVESESISYEDSYDELGRLRDQVDRVLADLPGS